MKELYDFFGDWVLNSWVRKADDHFLGEKFRNAFLNFILKLSVKQFPSCNGIIEWKLNAQNG